jgi:hypothetical protein
MRRIQLRKMALLKGCSCRAFRERQVIRMVLMSTKDNATIYRPGETIIDFRGNAWTFESISREPSPGKGGKIIASQPAMFIDSPRERWSQELYPSVFDAKITEG